MWFDNENNACFISTKLAPLDQQMILVFGNSNLYAEIQVNPVVETIGQLLPKLTENDIGWLFIVVPGQANL